MNETPEHVTDIADTSDKWITIRAAELQVGDIVCDVKGDEHPLARVRMDAVYVEIWRADTGYDERLRREEIITVKR